MNTEILLEHTASITSAPLRSYYLRDDGSVELLSEERRYSRNAAAPPAIILEFVRKRFFAALPRLAAVNESVYAMIPQGKTVILLGPVQLSVRLLLKHKYEDTQTELPDEVPMCNMSVFLLSVLLLFNLFHDTTISLKEVMDANCINTEGQDILESYTNTIHDNLDTGKRHNNYSQERRMERAISKGDLKLVEKCQMEEVGGDLGKMAKDPVRSGKNVAIIAVVLASRAAIRGGVNPELAFSLCDSYAEKIEDMTDLRNLKALVEGAEYQFASMVHQMRGADQGESNENRHPVVDRCVRYIFNHLHDKLTVNQAADALNVNPNYLSQLFKRYQGMSFPDFVLGEKISLAKNLLLYSNADLSEIASTLGFSSQSHFGKHFKDVTGMTPFQFRRNFSSVEQTDED